MRDREHEIQAACVAWFRVKYRKEIIFAIPNGGARNVATGVKLKEEGVLAGVPDLMILSARGGWNGLFVEMKKSSVGRNGQLVDKGRLSEVQRELFPRIEEKGYKIALCYSVDDFMREVEGYMNDEG